MKHGEMNAAFDLQRSCHEMPMPPGEAVIGTALHARYAIMHARLSLSVQGCHTLGKQYLLSALGMSE